uniref:Uncharacterized protein n=1 Tax=Pipistrellus kuhlii TaxID=59472 RepID=A0A7J7ZIS9_PIPKU|nr:hypothetical protein mPipKuh1_009411 [Pipistrellus kuhlii]
MEITEQSSQPLPPDGVESAWAFTECSDKSACCPTGAPSFRGSLTRALGVSPSASRATPSRTVHPIRQGARLIHRNSFKTQGKKPPITHPSTPVQETYNLGRQVPPLTVVTNLQKSRPGSCQLLPLQTPPSLDPQDS